jgi:rhodanese-related sulfurtransferase
VDVSIPYSNVQRVSLADAKAAFDSKSAVFVDVRDVDVYDTNHIQGALNIPLAVFDAQYTQLDRNQWIITYCT